MRRSGRLILFLGLLLLVAVGGIGFYLFSTQPELLTGQPPAQVAQPTEEPELDVVVAIAEIAPGTLITDTAGLFDVERVRMSQFNPDENFSSVAEVLNKVTVRQLVPDQRVRQSDLAEPGLSLRIPTAGPDEPRNRAYPLVVNPLTGVADQIRPGDFVDMIATFEIQRVVLRPSFDQQGLLIFREDAFTGRTTKTLVQNVQVLDVLKPPPPPEAEITPGAEQQPVGPDGRVITPTPGGPGTLPTGEWVLVLAVTNQEAEVIKFALDSQVTWSLVLRGAGDTNVDTTTGVTIDILTEQFGLPIPEPVDPASQQLTPAPAP